MGATNVLDGQGRIVQAILKSGVMKDNIPFFGGPIYYIDAELFFENKSSGVRRLNILGRSKALFDERIKAGLACKVEITNDLLLLNIIIE
jgi:hypothetical protein